MTIVRFLTIAWFFAVAGAAQAQIYHVRPDPTPDIPQGTYLFFDVIRLIQIFGAVAIALAIPGWIILKLWVRFRPAKDPLQLAMGDPWLRAKLEAMSDKERAEYLARIGK